MIARNPLRGFCWPLFFFMVVLMVVGVVFVYSANSIRESAKLRELYKDQAVMAGIGVAIGFALSQINYRWILRFRWFAYGGTLALLIAVLFMGRVEMGARRWVFGIQPSEFAKLAIIILLASYLGREGARQDIWELLLAGFLTVVPMGLILLQPDLGTTLVFLPVTACMLFAAKTATKTLLAIIALGILFIVVVFGSIVLKGNPKTPPPVQKACAIVLSPLDDYQQRRLLDFVYPDHDPMGSSWNLRQSRIAIGSGGKWGKGLLKGDQNILGYIPSQVSANDFIFSVLAEEKGFAGSVFVLLCFGGLILSMMSVAAVAPDGPGRLLCVGVSALIFCHAFINIGMTIGVMPVTGLPLPFLSYGRTFMLTVAIAVGLVQSVAVQSMRQEKARIDSNLG